MRLVGHGARGGLLWPMGSIRDPECPRPTLMFGRAVTGYGRYPTQPQVALGQEQLAHLSDPQLALADVPS